MPEFEEHLRLECLRLACVESSRLNYMTNDILLMAKKFEEYILGKNNNQLKGE